MPARDIVFPRCDRAKLETTLIELPRFLPKQSRRTFPGLIDEWERGGLHIRAAAIPTAYFPKSRRQAGQAIQTVCAERANANLRTAIADQKGLLAPSKAHDDMPILAPGAEGYLDR